MPERLRRSPRDRELITPEGIALPITVASKGARAGALFMDLGFITVLQIVTTITLASIAFGGLAQFFEAGDKAGGIGALEFLFVLWIIAMFLFRNAYFLFFELGPRGATPGKRLAGIRVAARDGGRLSVEMVIARNLLRDIELFLPFVFIASAGEEDAGAAILAGAAWFLIFALFPFWNRDRLRAGDIVAGSWVVEQPKRKLEAAMSATQQQGAESAMPAFRFSDDELDVYGEYELQTLERVLREDRDESLVKVQQTIAGKIGRSDGEGEERAFLDAYYNQLRARLEARMRMGERKADKFA
ncbi:MAG: RDD family protein [Novosphingobium sp.]|nr:RDD family protein [Novosphingobium sp.]